MTTNTVTTFEHFKNLPAAKDRHIFHQSAVGKTWRYYTVNGEAWHKIEANFLSTLKIANNIRCLEHLNKQKLDQAPPSPVSKSCHHVFFRGLQKRTKTVHEASSTYILIFSGPESHAHISVCNSCYPMANKEYSLKGDCHAHTAQS